MKKIDIIPTGVCADCIHVQVEGDTIAGVQFEGGCNGNGQALGKLLEGMPVEEAIKRLKGVSCQGSGTSCADQLVRGLAEKLDKPY